MSNSFEDAAQILRELRERVEAGESAAGEVGEVNVFRGVTDVGLGADSVTVTVDASPTAVYDSDDYDHTEYGD
jgi:NifU-like protein involved in Fe-S cluster formation